MKIALCNEVLAPLELEYQCELAARLGYDGLEIAPFTLAESPERITSDEARGFRSIVESNGLVVTGLHWLLVRPTGLSVTDPDAGVRRRTLEVVTRLIGSADFACKEIVFSVDTVEKKTPHRAFYTATVCQDGTTWKWASAEPATARWGALQ